MRSLRCDIPGQPHSQPVTDSVVFCQSDNATQFERNLSELRLRHHSRCIFNRQPFAIPYLHFSFDDLGIFQGNFTCNEHQQGYDGMVHGGIISAIIDASMAQCLMGHGVVGYTTDLSIRYRKPLLIHKTSSIRTSITCVNVGVLYTMNCEITQDNHVAVSATGKFYKVNHITGTSQKNDDTLL